MAYDDDEEDEGDTTPAADPETLRIFLHAVTCVRPSNAMHLSIRLGDATLHALVDMGSTHNFLSQESAARVRLPLIQRAGLHVTVANGDKVPSPGIFQDARISIDSEVFVTDLYVLPLGSYDLVLSMQWLSTLGQILWDFGQLTMSFWHKDHMVLWRSLPTGAPLVAHAATTQDLLDDLLSDSLSSPTSSPRPPACPRRVVKTTASPCCQTLLPWWSDCTATRRATRMNWNDGVATWSLKASFAASRPPSAQRSSWSRRPTARGAGVNPN